MIEICDINKKYKNKTVLKDVSLSAQEGKMIGILGVNGSGKSTLLSILAGVLDADSGKMMYRDTDLLEKNNRKHRSSIVGYVPQANPLIEELTAWDNLLLWCDRETVKRELSDGLLAMLGIDEFIKVPVFKMSGGMKKRLSIGCTVVNRPQILLLDEPCASLDIVCKDSIYNYYDNYLAGGGTIFLATHELEEIERCDKCYIINEGIVSEYNFDNDIHKLAGLLSR